MTLSLRGCVSNCHSFFIESRTTYLNDAILVLLALNPGGPTFMDSFFLHTWAVMVLPPVSYICPSPLYISVFAVSVSLPRQFFHSLCARTVAGPVAIQRSVQSLVLGVYCSCLQWCFCLYRDSRIQVYELAQTHLHSLTGVLTPLLSFIKYIQVYELAQAHLHSLTGYEPKCVKLPSLH